MFEKTSHFGLKLGFIAFSLSVFRITFRTSSVFRLSISLNFDWEIYSLHQSPSKNHMLIWLYGDSEWKSNWYNFYSPWNLPQTLQSVNKRISFARLVFAKTMDNGTQHFVLSQNAQFSAYILFIQLVVNFISLHIKNCDKIPCNKH